VSTGFLQRARPLVLARLASACFTVSIPLVLARLLSLPDYGTYKQLFLISQTLYYVLPFGMAQSLYFFIPRGGTPRAWFAQTLTFLLGAGALAGMVLYAGADLLAHGLGNPALAEHRAALALYTACSIGAFPLELSMTSQGKTRRSALTYLVSDLLRAAALTLPVLLGAGLQGVMIAIAAFAALRLGAAWWLMIGRTEGPLWHRGGFRRQLLYAAPFGAAILLSIPQQYAHQFAVAGAVGPALFAIYAAGCFQVPLVDLLYTPTSEVLMVRLGELDREGRLEEGLAAFREASARLTYAFIPMAALLFAVAPDFITTVFGARFAGAVPIFRVSLLVIPLAALPLDGVLRARGLTRALFFSYLTKAAVTVPLVFFGVRLFGMMGGITAWALAEAVGKATLLVRVPVALSTPGRRLSLVEVVPWGAVVRALVAAAVASLAAVAVKRAAGLAQLDHAALIRLVVASLAFGAAYLVGLRLTGLSPRAAWAGAQKRELARGAA
jgi:O-antigen/teichoic acid export membrane protein